MNLVDLTRAVQHLSIEKLQSANGLAYPGTAPLLLRHYMKQIASDLLGTELFRRPAMKLGELLDCSHIDLDRDSTVAPQYQFLLETATQLRHQAPPLGTG